MKLTDKDKQFLERLRGLFEEKELSVELVHDGFKRMVLRRNYGDNIERSFGMTRQGVRWRFQRIMNDIYVEAYGTIYLVEKLFGTELRPMALEIAKERAAFRKEALKTSDSTFYRRQKVSVAANQSRLKSKGKCPPDAGSGFYLKYTLSGDI